MEVAGAARFISLLRGHWLPDHGKLWPHGEHLLRKRERTTIDKSGGPPLSTFMLTAP